MAQIENLPLDAGGLHVLTDAPLHQTIDDQILDLLSQVLTELRLLRRGMVLMEMAAEVDPIDELALQE